MTTSYSTWLPVEREGWGFSQEKSALYLFTRSTIYIFKVGDPPFGPVCLKKHRGAGWRFCYGDDVLNFPYMKLKADEYPIRLREAMLASEPGAAEDTWRYDHFEQFFTHLNSEALSQTLSTRTRAGCWPLYCTLVRVKQATDLLHTPALVLALSQAWRFIEKRVCKQMRRIRGLARKPARHILGDLGFPARRSSLRVLRKLTPESLSVPSLLGLRALINSMDPSTKWLHHLERINQAALRLMSHPTYRSRYRWSLLDECAHLPEGDDADALSFVHLLNDTARMLGDRPLPTLTDLGSLRRLHDNLLEEFRKTDVDYQEFPKPPLPGVPDAIEPITNSHALFQEGQLQANCLVASQSWSQSICEGNYYVYRILSPERASLGLRRDQGRWSIEQLYGAGNRPLDGGRTMVEEWLNSHGSGAGKIAGSTDSAAPCGWDVHPDQLRFEL